MLGSLPTHTHTRPHAPSHCPLCASLLASSAAILSALSTLASYAPPAGAGVPLAPAASPPPALLYLQERQSLLARADERERLAEQLRKTQRELDDALMQATVARCARNGVALRANSGRGPTRR